MNNKYIKIKFNIEQNLDKNKSILIVSQDNNVTCAFIDKLSSYMKDSLFIDFVSKDHKTNKEHRDNIISMKLNEKKLNYIDTKEFSEDIKEKKSKYDYVFLASNNTRKQVDHLLLTKISDSVIILVNEFKSTKKEIEDLVTFFRQNNIHILGVVYNS